MNNVIAHIVGLDEIHKKKLITHLPSNIRVIDLDAIQQSIYNHINTVNQKQLWEKITRDINIKQKQKNLVGTKGIDPLELTNQIKKLMAKRNNVRQQLHQIWKDKMSEEIDNKLLLYNKHQILFIGFNINPKDYRIRINIPIQSQPSNKIFLDIKPSLYAANQIKFHLKAYADKIIRGDFPLNLLTHSYLESKYEKFVQYYINLNYVGVAPDDLYSTITELSRQISDVKNIFDSRIVFDGKNNANTISTGKIYVATLYKSGDIIPVNSKTPLEGFATKDGAISNIKPKLKRNSPIYIYELEPDQFRMVGGKLLATQELYPINEESCLLTI